MYSLFSPNTFSVDHFIVFVPTDGASMLTLPQEMEGAAIAGAIGTFGGQVNDALEVLLHVTSQADDGGASLGAGWG